MMAPTPSPLSTEDIRNEANIATQLEALSVTARPAYRSGEVPPSPLASSAPAQPPKEFPLFPSLPTEIRLKIWESVLSHTRIIEIRASPAATATATGMDWTESRTPPPLAVLALLAACRESRREALRCFSVTDLQRFWSPPWQVKLDTDMIYLDFSTCVKFRDNMFLGGAAKSFVRHLILPSRLFNDHPWNYATLTFLMFRCVEQVTVVMVEGPRTEGAAELISLKKAAERSHVAASLIGSAEVIALEARLEKIKEWYRKGRPFDRVPVFRIMAMDRREGTNMANSFISFRI